MEYLFNEKQYQEAFFDVLNEVTKNVAIKRNHAVLFLGAQPGAGKSTFSNMDSSFADYIKINGDEYRKNHPFYKEIMLYERENMAELTQPFVNRVVEHLIEELSKEGYNLIIEGTLRDPNVPISTCNILKGKGYTTELYVIGCDACESWESTINRAKLMAEIEHSPRLVPIEKYNVIVNNLIDSLRTIENADCMDKIVLLSRDSRILWKRVNENSNIHASDVLEKVLDVSKWNKQFEEYKKQYENFVKTIKNKPLVSNVKRGGR